MAVGRGHTVLSPIECIWSGDARIRPPSERDRRRTDKQTDMQTDGRTDGRIMPPPYRAGHSRRWRHHASVRPSVCLHVCLSVRRRSRSLGGCIRASPLQMHSIGDSTVCYWDLCVMCVWRVHGRVIVDVRLVVTGGGAGHFAVTKHNTSTFNNYNDYHAPTTSSVFNARRYASAVYAVVVCLSVYHTLVLYPNG